MTRHSNIILSEISELVRKALPIRWLTKQSSSTRSHYRSIRALGAAFIVIATLLSTFDATAVSGSRSTKYGTLSYSIPNLDGRYKPGQHYTLTATFAANSRVYGDKKGWTGTVVVMGME